MRLQPFTIYQPTYPAGINWGHSLAEGLLACVSGRHRVPVELVTGIPGVATSPTTSSTTGFLDGSALDVSATKGVRFDFGNQPSFSLLTKQVSGLFRGQFAGTGIQAIFGTNGGVGVPLEGSPLLLYTSSAGTQPGFMRCNAAGGFSWHRSGTSFPTARPMTYAFSQGEDATSTPVFWQDGAFTTPGNDGLSVTTAQTTTNAQLRIGNRVSGDRQFTGYFAAGMLWARQLTPTDLAAIGAAPYQIFRPSAWKSRVRLSNAAYTMAADVGTFTLTGQDAGLNIGRTMAADVGAFVLTGNDVELPIGRVMSADTGVFTLTGNDAGLTVTTSTPTAAGRAKKRRRERNAPVELGNKDFLGSRRNSRPGVAEEEMREVLAAVKAKAVPIPLDAIEDDDEEAILWLV